MPAAVPADWCALSWIVAGSRGSSGSDCSELSEEGKWRQSCLWTRAAQRGSLQRLQIPGSSLASDRDRGSVERLLLSHTGMGRTAQISRGGSGSHQAA